MSDKLCPSNDKARMAAGHCEAVHPFLGAAIFCGGEISSVNTRAKATRLMWDIAAQGRENGWEDDELPQNRAAPAG